MYVTAGDFENILTTLKDVFHGEEYVIILLYLTRNFKKEEDYKDSTQLLILKNLLNDAKEFAKYIRRLCAEAEVPSQISQAMESIYSTLRIQSNAEHRDNATVINIKAVFENAGVGLAYALAAMSPEIQAEVASSIPLLLNFNCCGDITIIVKSTMDKMGILGKNAAPVLAMVYLTYEGLRAIYRWWKGEITGMRCAKMVFDNVVTVVAGYGASVLGAQLGSYAGPYGMLIGGVAGGITGSVIAATIVDYCSRCCFDLPKDEAVEMAYRYLGLDHHAEVDEINRAFRAACIRLHPDSPGGSNEQYIRLQSCMSIIKISRGAQYD